MSFRVPLPCKPRILPVRLFSRLAFLVMCAICACGITWGQNGSVTFTFSPPSDSLFTTIGTNQYQAFTITLNGSLATPPTGTLTFSQNGQQSSAFPVVNGSVSGYLFGGGGTEYATLPVGVNTITCTYSGDSNYGNASSAYIITVTPGTNQTTLNASASKTVVYTNEASIIQAFVAANGAYPPGTVTYFDGATSLGTGQIDSQGNSSFDYTPTTAGQHTITALYPANDTYRGSSDSVTINVLKPTTPTVNVTSTPDTIDLGQSALLQATVVPPKGSTITPAGTVSFSTQAAQNQLNLGTVTLDATGAATLTTTALPAGTDVVFAAYSGNLESYTFAIGNTTVKVNGATSSAPADFAVTSNPGSGTVSGRGVFSTLIAVQPANGFSSDVALTCSGLPTNTTCSFTPGTVKPAENGGATLLTISTGGATQSTSSLQIVGGHPLTVLACISLFGLGFSRRRKHPLLAVALLAGISAAGALGLSSCGGSSMSNAPSGDYMVTITATSGSLSHQTTFALHVN